VAKILVADDNSNIQKMVGLALKDQGIDVVAVGNGEAAVRKISDLRPDLVLADVFMPVRNGYEVCRYVKQDSRLSHIPVILLVGAFDPLDEQEAQRVGADGVLKKPFVPPDPLISMVKSALTRAGVPLGPAPHTEKPPATATTRSAADLLGSGTGPKITVAASDRIPEAAPEPIEEFPTPTPPPSVKIAAGHEPLAFGSLLETPEAEDESIFQPKSPVQLGGGDRWAEEGDEVKEEVEEEESPSGGWHPSGLEAEPEGATPSHAAPDWREEAFHGNSPAKTSGSHSWTPASEPVPLIEAAEAPAVAISTIERKPLEGPVPFTGDAWAAAMAAGVEEKLTEIGATEAPAAEETAAETKEHVSEEARTAETGAFERGTVAQETSSDQTKEAQPANGWFSVAGTPWEIEAKKATLLASTWDAPIAGSPDETQEVLPISAQEPAVVGGAVSEAPAEVHAAEPASHQERTTAPAEPATTANWGSAWETPPSPVPSFEPPIERIAEVAEPKVEEPGAQESHHAAAAEEPQSVQPNMDELVARVVARMNPEVLQKVTREILKPVIEAIIRDELDSQKS